MLEFLSLQLTDILNLHFAVRRVFYPKWLRIPFNLLIVVIISGLRTSKLQIVTRFIWCHLLSILKHSK